MAFRHGVLGEKEEGSELTALDDTAWRLRASTDPRSSVRAKVCKL
jgi:hypothetical protein